MKKAGVIDRAVVGLFLSEFEYKKPTIQIGDYDTDYVEGGELGLDWFELTTESQEWKWHTDLTDCYFGGKKLFQHYFKWAELNAGYSGIGLTSEDFAVA